MMTMIPDADINVTVIDFKNTKSKEMVTENPDGTYSIFINARFSYEEQYKAFNHALKHIKENDFRKADVQEIEAIAHFEKPVVKEGLSDFQKRILEEIRKSRKRIQRELQKIEERNAWLEENIPDYFSSMEGYFLERQRLGDY